MLMMHDMNLIANAIRHLKSFNSAIGFSSAETDLRKKS